MSSTTITVNVDSEVVKKLKRLATIQKQKKGFLGRTITEATRRYIEEREQEETRKRLLIMLKKGFIMGRILAKHRSELYDR